MIGRFAERSIVQTTQVADGDVCRALAIPINVYLPAHFVMPSTVSPQFSVQFELNLVISFSQSDTKLVETFPLILYR